MHTPDGTPCGLLNHLSAACRLVTALYPTMHLPRLLCDLGMQPYDMPATAAGGTLAAGDHGKTKASKEPFPVMLDGQMVGWLDEDCTRKFVDDLRMLKVKGICNVSFEYVGLNILISCPELKICREVLDWLAYHAAAAAAPRLWLNISVASPKYSLKTRGAIYPLDILVIHVWNSANSIICVKSCAEV